MMEQTLFAQTIKSTMKFLGVNFVVVVVILLCTLSPTE